MSPPSRLILIAAAVLPLTVAVALAQQKQQKLYRWVDEGGVVHYGDQIPAKYASRDRAILNSQGIAVEYQQGELSESEKADRKKEAAAEAARLAAKAEIAKHDRMLLQTYLTVDDIEKLRDRRLEVLDSQIKVTERYLTGLQARLADLKSEASRYAAPPGDRPAIEVPASLEQEIVDVTTTVTSYQDTLDLTRRQQADVRQSFGKDIARFKQLKGD